MLNLQEIALKVSWLRVPFGFLVGNETTYDEPIRNRLPIHLISLAPYLFSLIALAHLGFVIVTLMEFSKKLNTAT